MAAYEDGWDIWKSKGPDAEGNFWVHILPTGDPEPGHTISDSGQCICNPTLERGEEWWMVVHNSLDGREGLEKAIEILGLDNGHRN